VTGTQALSIDQVDRAAAAPVDALTDILVGAVDAGASVGFLPPLDAAVARAYWSEVAAEAGRGAVVLLVARLDSRVVGTVQLVPEPRENQPHRADIRKLLVASEARRRGVGRALMGAAEARAATLGRWLLCLDTLAGSAADRLYGALGWVRVGEIPDFALMPDGRTRPTALHYRDLRGGAR